RSFLRTGRALIDVYGEEITLQINDEAVTFNLNQTTRYSSTYEDLSINLIDIIDVAREEYAQEILGFFSNSLGGNPTSTFEPILSDFSLSLTPFEGSDFILEEIEAYRKDESISPEIDHADYLELKELPSNLEYAYLEGVDKLPVIIAKDLKVNEKEALLKVLKSHKRAIAWKSTDIKGFVRNKDGVDFLTGDRSSNLYTISLNEVASNSSTCLLAKASSLQSWLFYQRLSHLNFATINNLVKNNLVQGLPKLKFKKGHLCSACEQGKIHQKHHKSKTAFDSNKPLYLLHMDLCGPMRVETENSGEFHSPILLCFSWDGNDEKYVLIDVIIWQEVPTTLCGYEPLDSLLLTPLCCDDIHDVTPRVFALTGCDRLVSEPGCYISRFTQRFEETFGEAWERFKEMLRACPHHGFMELAQIDTFYNGLNYNDQDFLNAATGGNLLSKTTREALQVIKNKSNVRYSINKPNVSRMNTTSRENASKTDDRIDKLADQISTLVDIFAKKVVTPASGEIKAITTRSDVAYEGPSITTNLSPKKVVERENEETTDKDQTNFKGSTAPIQPPVTPISKPNVSKTLPKLNIPYPSRLNDQKLREKATNQMEKEEYAQEIFGFSNNSSCGNPTLTSEPILSDSSLSLTPFEGSDFILEEIEAYLKDESISLEINHVDCNAEGDICLIENC
nr:reverse transcriptase domain-containing protein [Tanacetum cinerariifolium]